MSKARKEGKKEMITLPVIISIILTIITAYMAYIQYHYSEAEYRYKREPQIMIKAHFGMYIENEDNNLIKKPYISEFVFDMKHLNNLDKLYFVNSKFEVRQIYVKKLEKLMRKYFEEEYSNKKCDLETKKYKYFYRFLITKGVDGDINLNVLVFKTQDSEIGEKVELTFKQIDDIEIMEYEKAHIDNPSYDGERIIARQFRDIQKRILQNQLNL